jgi:hypothetical protein
VSVKEELRVRFLFLSSLCGDIDVICMVGVVNPLPEMSDATLRLLLLSVAVQCDEQTVRRCKVT